MTYSNLCASLKADTTIILVNLFYDQIDLDSTTEPKAMYSNNTVLDMIVSPFYGKDTIIVRIAC